MGCSVSANTNKTIDPKSGHIYKLTFPGVYQAGGPFQLQPFQGYIKFNAGLNQYPQRPGYDPNLPSGIRQYQDGTSYTGQFLHEDRHSYGEQSWKSGDIFKGQSNGGHRDGYGEYFWKSGEVYKGEWANGNKHGEGETYEVGGAVYFGTFVDNKYHGYGEMKWPDGGSYHGNWNCGKRSGYGEMQFADGSLYRGYWLNHFINGPGEKSHPNRIIEKGLWENGKLIQNNHNLQIGQIECQSPLTSYYQYAVAYQQLPNGQVQPIQIVRIVRFEAGTGRYPDRPGFDPLLNNGQKTLNDGSTYTGQFLQEKMHGYGEMKFANGDLYKGQWDSGKRDGYGEYYWPNGNTYKGMFANGTRNGQGEMYDNISHYYGRFLDSKFHGYGERTWKDGNIYKGTWLFGERSGYGEMKFNDGRMYRGYWLKHFIYGPGEMYHPDGNIEKGIWANGKLIISAQCEMIQKLTIQKFMAHLHSSTLLKNPYNLSFLIQILTFRIFPSSVLSLFQIKKIHNLQEVCQDLLQQKTLFHFDLVQKKHF